VDVGDIIALSEGILFAGTWIWVLRAKRSWIGWREKSAFFGFLCVSLAVILDLFLTAVMHLRGDSNFAATLFTVTFIAGILLSIAGMVLAIMGKGTPKVATLIWSALVLISAGATVVVMVTAIHPGNV
jgi:hypothetical protein